MGNTNAFEGLDGYSVHLIRYKAQRLIGYLGLTESDREDIEQDLAIHLRQNLPKHDASRGSLKTFINCVLDNRVKAIIKSRSCSTLDVRMHAYSIDAAAESARFDEFTMADILDTDDYQIMLGNVNRTLIEMVELRIDVRRAVSSLPEDLQKVCKLLSYTTVTAAARELGIKRSKLYEMMRRLRDILSAAGIKNYS
ncbi:MAG: hypothetical protein ABFD83_14325 [Armatimonadota bacterium]